MFIFFWVTLFILGIITGTKTLVGIIVQGDGWKKPLKLNFTKFIIQPESFNSPLQKVDWLALEEHQSQSRAHFLFFVTYTILFFVTYTIFFSSLSLLNMSVSMSPRSANMMFGVILVLLVSCFFINITAGTPAPDCKGLKCSLGVEFCIICCNGQGI